MIAFHDVVSCRREDSGPVGLTMMGRTSDHPAEVVHLHFTCPPGVYVPEVLENPLVERFDARRYVIRSGGQEWFVPATTVHLHREIGTVFYQAIPPRPVPIGKRIFWRVVLGLIARPWGKRLLLFFR